MKKEAIIDIIASDLKEIEILLNNMKEGEKIEGAFIDLLLTKHENIAREITLLDYWRNDSKNTQTTETRTNSNSTTTIEKEEPKVAQPVATAPKAIETPAVTVVSAPVAEKPKLVEVTKPAENSKPIEPIKPAEAPKPIEPVKPAEAPKPIEPAKPAEAPKTEPIVEKKPEPTPVEAKTAEPVKRTAKASDVKNYGTPVDDVKKAISIADRFLYQKELFAGNANDFTAALNIINTMGSYEESERYLLATYGWDIESKTTEAFLKAVRRRFI